jgi:hypothetical protein
VAVGVLLCPKGVVVEQKG